MRLKRPFRSLIVCVSCAMVGCILASTAYSRRVDELEIERDIYASRFQNWQTRAIDAEENVSRLQTEVDNLTAELNAQTDLTLTYPWPRTSGRCHLQSGYRRHRSSWR